MNKKKIDTKGMLKELESILTDGVMNENLRYAVEEIKKALESGNLVLATELTGVKSFITSNMKGTFTEDMKLNREKFERSIYAILDCMHHELAFAQDTIPSGMMLISPDSIYVRPPPESVHPVLKMMNEEHDKIVKEVKEMRERIKKA